MSLKNQIHPTKLACIDAALHDSAVYNSFKDDVILITGARGYFGRYLVEAFLRMNELYDTNIEVVAMDSDATGTQDTWSEWMNLPRLSMMRHNVRHDVGQLGRGLIPTRIFHLAGIASPYWYKKFPLETIDVAVKGTEQMLKLAKECGAKFLFTSSSEVYQTASKVPTPETYVGAIPSCNDRSSYDVSKLMAETLCYVYAEKLGVATTIVRIFNSFGPGMAQSDRRIMTRIADCMKSRGKLTTYSPLTIYAPVFSSPLPSRTYTPVANTLRGVLYAAAYGESVGAMTHLDARGIYNVGNDKSELSVKALIQLVERLTGIPVPHLKVTPPQEYQTEPLRRCPDITRLKKLGYSEAMTLEEGLKLFFQWSQEVYK